MRRYGFSRSIGQVDEAFGIVVDWLDLFDRPTTKTSCEVWTTPDRLVRMAPSGRSWKGMGPSPTVCFLLQRGIVDCGGNHALAAFHNFVADQRGLADFLGPEA